MLSTRFTHRYNRVLLSLSVLIALALVSCVDLHAQESDTIKNVPVDTVVLSPFQIKPISLNCYMISGYGSGDEELIAINSKSDAISAFGYNCDVPDSDYTNYTLLCCSVKSTRDIGFNVKIYGDNLLLTLNTYKGMTLMKHYYVRLLIPKLARNSNMHLDVNEQ